EQARHPAPDAHATGRGFRDARKHLQERRLASAVAPNDADDVTTTHVEVDVAKCPHLLELVALDYGPTVQHVAGLPYELPRAACDDVAQDRIALPSGLVSDDVLLAEILDAYDDVTHIRRDRRTFAPSRENV